MSEEETLKKPEDVSEALKKLLIDHADEVENKPIAQIAQAPQCSFEKWMKGFSSIGVLIGAILIPCVISKSAEDHSEKLTHQRERHEIALQSSRMEYQRLVDARAQFNIPLSKEASEEDKADYRLFRKMAAEDIAEFDPRFTDRPEEKKQFLARHGAGDSSGVIIGGSDFATSPGGFEFGNDFGADTGFSFGDENEKRNEDSESD